MVLAALLPFLAVIAAASCGIVYGLALAQGRIRALYSERNEALMRVSSQAATIDRLLRRRQPPVTAGTMSRRAG